MKKYIPIIIACFLVLNVTLLIRYFTHVPKGEFKEMPSRFTYRSVKLPKPVKAINKSVISDKTIYLTFDDGPSYLTEDILNILKEEGVPATFFVTSKQIDEYSNDIIRMVKENHAVALHTSTHNYSYVYSSLDNYFNDLNDISNKVQNITGKYINIVRLPGGSSNTVSKRYSIGVVSLIVNRLNEYGYYYYDWNIDSEDASGSLSKEQIYNNVTTRLHSGTNIILMHDSASKKTTMEALRDIIIYGKSNGYTFSKITVDTPAIHHRINN